MRTKRTRAALAATLLLALTAAACGGDDDGDGTAASAAKKPNAVDAAFVNDMVPHHEAAIEMAELAKERAEHPEIRRLADEIIAAQASEIETMKELGLDVDPDAHMSGDAHTRGMDVDIDELGEADPFDRAFIDMMIPHHEGAVTMAKEELARGGHPALLELARNIVSAQEREIAQMREWRERWYGADAGSTDEHGSGH